MCFPRLAFSPLCRDTIKKHYHGRRALRKISRARSLDTCAAHCKHTLIRRDGAHFGTRPTVCAHPLCEYPLHPPQPHGPASSHVSVSIAPPTCPTLFLTDCPSAQIECQDCASPELLFVESPGLCRPNTISTTRVASMSLPPTQEFIATLLVIILWTHSDWSVGRAFSVSSENCKTHRVNVTTTITKENGG